MVTARKKRKGEILLGFVKLYLSTGKAIGSNTLRENGFKSISSATIRNYFAQLEEEGFLIQQHTSGGRIPTEKAYKAYADEMIDSQEIDPKHEEWLVQLFRRDTRKISSLLQEGVELLASICGGAVFLFSPRFDQDFIVDMKLIQIDEERCLCVIVTDFSLIHTETLYTKHQFSSFSLKRIEEFFHFRLTGLDRPHLSPEEEAFAQQAYNEVVLRHFVSYTNFSQEDVYRSGFSNLLNFKELYDPLTLSNTLSLFENPQKMRQLLGTCWEEKKPQCWIGSDLSHLIAPPFPISIVGTSYSMNQTAVGTLAILGPDRQEYHRIFPIITCFAKLLGESLTRNLYKHKISYREPEQRLIDTKVSLKQIGQNQNPFIES